MSCSLNVDYEFSFCRNKLKLVNKFVFILKRRFNKSMNLVLRIRCCIDRTSCNNDILYLSLLGSNPATGNLNSMNPTFSGEWN